MEQCEVCNGTGCAYSDPDGNVEIDCDCEAFQSRPALQFPFADDDDYLDPFADADDCRAEALTIAERN